MTTFLTVIFIKQATDESRFSDRSTLNQSKHDRSVQKLQREDNTNFRLSENYRELRAFKSDDSNVIDLQRNFPFSSTSLLAFFILSILNLFRLNLFFSFSFDKPLISCFPSSWLDKTCIIVYCFTTQRSSQINNR